MTDFNGKVQGNFVDDDDIVRTGRAMIELNGYGFMQVPIPTGLKQAWDDLRGESSSSLQEIRSKAAQAASSADSASKSAAAAKTSENNAASSKNAAASSAAAAGKSESNAASSASAAKTSEQAAAGSASSASSSAAAAKTSETNAASSAAAAKTSESNAATSKSAAASSASSAKQDADRAVKARTGIEEIAATTSWSGDRLTVNGKTSPPLKGDKGDKGDPGDVTNVTWDVVKNKPATFPPEKHNHTVADVSDLNNKFANRDMSSQATGYHLVMRDAAGRAQFAAPVANDDAANKQYVDSGDTQSASVVPTNVNGQLWAQDMGLSIIADSVNPSIGRVYQTAVGAGNLAPQNHWFAVDPSLDYYVSFWVKASAPNSVLFLELRDGTGNHAVKNYNYNASSGNSYLVNKYTVPTEWTRVYGRLTLNDGASRVKLGTFYFNHSAGTERNAQISLSDIQFVPIPKGITSADIVDSQNGHTLTSTNKNGGRIVQISTNGTLEVHANNMTNGNGNAVVNKAYVDSLATEVRAFAASRAVVKQVTSPPSSFESGVLYVIPE